MATCRCVFHGAFSSQIGVICRTEGGFDLDRTRQLGDGPQMRTGSPVGTEKGGLRGSESIWNRTVKPDIYHLRGQKPRSHVYLIRGNTENALIDTGITGEFPVLQACGATLNLAPKDSWFCLLRNRLDHVAATAFFHAGAGVAAQRMRQTDSS